MLGKEAKTPPSILKCFKSPCSGCRQFVSGSSFQLGTFGTIGIQYHFKVSKTFIHRHRLRLGELYVTSKPPDKMIREASRHCPSVVTIGSDEYNVAKLTQSILGSSGSVVCVATASCDRTVCIVHNLVKSSQGPSCLVELKADSPSVVFIHLHHGNEWCTLVYSQGDPALSKEFINNNDVTRTIGTLSYVYTSEMNFMLARTSTMVKLASIINSNFKPLFLSCKYPIFVTENLGLATVVEHVDTLILTFQCADALLKHFDLRWRFCKMSAKVRNIRLWLDEKTKKSSTVIVTDFITEAHYSASQDYHEEETIVSEYSEALPLINTTGIDNAFVAGYISTINKGLDTAKGIRCGFLCSATIGVEEGTDFPEDCPQLMLIRRMLELKQMQCPHRHEPAREPRMLSETAIW